MTSSLRSKFDFFDRRALFLAGDKLIIYHWRGGALADSFVFNFGVSNASAFDWDGEGVGENFEGVGSDDLPLTPLAMVARYLRETPLIPTYLFVDVVEEEFRLDTAPHVVGRDRRALINRKINRLFRNAPYYSAIRQGRETEGRRDDRYLFTALTNPGVISDLTELLAQHKVPLAGIYSLPLLSERLLPKIGASSANTLLVSMQSASGLRQSFFRNGELKVSRLAKMPRLGTVPLGPHVLGELDKTRRYLNSLRLASREAPLDVYLLSSGGTLSELKSHCADSDAVRYHMIDIAQLGRQFGISGALTTPYSDVIYVHLLLSEQPKNQYARAQETTYYSLYKTRIGMIAAGVLLLLGSVAWGGFNFIQGISLQQEAIDSNNKANYYDTRYQTARQRLPKTPVSPEQIKTAVDLAATLAEYKTSPVDAMLVISRALGESPSVQIDKIDWRASTNPEAAADPAKAMTTAGANAKPGSPAAPDTPGGQYRYYQIAEVTGHLTSFGGDYREALELVNRFAETLRKQNDMYDVKIVKPPVDVSSKASLQGNANQPVDARQAEFALRVVLGVSRHGKS